MALIKSRNLLIWFSTLLLISPGIAVMAQTDEAPDRLIHVCVSPSDGSMAYLVTFRDTDLDNNSGGFVLPTNANIVVYGTETTLARVGIYNFLPDAQTGGYRRAGEEAGEVATALTRTDLQRSGACTSDVYDDIISDENPTTISLEVTPSQAVFIEFLQPDPPQANEDTASGDQVLEGDPATLPPKPDVIATAPILGVFSLHFRPDLGVVEQDIQLLQTSAGGIEVSFPGIRDVTTRFVAIGNKDFAARISFADFPNEPLEPVPANTRPNFSRLLAGEHFPVGTDTTLDLFRLMIDAHVQFYPYGGIISEYPARGYIRLDVAPESSQRNPAFEDGVTVRAIEGASPTYIAEENPTIINTMNPTDQARVRQISENGQLIITSGRVGSSAIVDSWLVEVISD